MQAAAAAGVSSWAAPGSSSWPAAGQGPNVAAGERREDDNNDNDTGDNNRQDGTAWFFVLLALLQPAGLHAGQRPCLAPEWAAKGNAAAASGSWLT